MLNDFYIQSHKCEIIYRSTSSSRVDIDPTHKTKCPPLAEFEQQNTRIAFLSGLAA